MDERSSRRKKREHDFSVTAFRVVEAATADAEDAMAVEEKPSKTEGKNPNAVALGRLGGHKGGKARATALSPERRREIAQKAANARWGKADANHDNR